MTTPDETVEGLARVLRAAGLTQLPGEYDSDIHGWRCSYPDIYGPCSCFQELVADLAAYVAEREAAVLREAADEWEDCGDEDCSDGCWLPRRLRERAGRVGGRS